VTQVNEIHDKQCPVQIKGTHSLGTIPVAFIQASLHFLVSAYSIEEVIVLIEPNLSAIWSCSSLRVFNFTVD
jgi:hypothetical protein